MSELLDLIKNRLTFKILIVDDKPNMRRTIRNMLRMYGFNLFGEAEDGDVAVAKIRSEKFDFVIIDWNMPRMNGVEVLRIIREDDQYQDLPFLMVTAEVEEGTVAEVIEAEVDGYILKPFIPKTLEEKMIEIMKRKLAPPPLDTHLRQAEAYRRAGKFDQAHLELDNATHINSRSPKIHFSRGLLFEAEGDLEKAELAFATARQAGPKFIKAHEKLASIYEKQGKASEMLAVLKEAVSVSPKNAQRQTKLGEALLSEGRVQEAKQAFNAAIKLDPDNPARKAAIGEAYLAHGLSQDAERAFKSSIQSDPENIHVYNRLGIAFRRQKKFEEAVTYYLKALGISPLEPNLLFNLARAYLGFGRSGDAADALKRALSIKPDFVEASELLNKIQAGTS
jgi:DNA-binding response OmpR family regulator